MTEPAGIVVGRSEETDHVLIQVRPVGSRRSWTRWSPSIGSP
ncbi:hypothetical protein [Nonomuraea rubra]|uniref:Uncharacterized protein n=1 Tax=Nonomuraea rubra TaxID=46180 RepID=A0A7X0P6C1_9ACTN|nr:hypothetical protein [Nonomuraea rubra]MBB6555877.1 hypothetical protein [Nonomuraea rubra]